MVKIRRAHREDIPALTGLLAELFAQEAEFTPDREANARGLAMVLASDNTGMILVADDGGGIAGMVMLLYTVSTALGARVAILEDMVVRQGNRGGGVGRKLLAQAIETARSAGCQRITLLTDHDNHRAQRFYQEFGFTRSPMVPFRRALARELVA
jgi:GNAT superfamily N-acetyltransferase